MMSSSTSENASIVRTLFDLFFQSLFFLFFSLEKLLYMYALEHVINHTRSAAQVNTRHNTQSQTQTSSQT